MIEKATECPDGGCCHHFCAEGNCFRVGCCGPLSNTYPNNTWPEDLVFDMDFHISFLKSCEIMDKLKTGLTVNE